MAKSSRIDQILCGVFGAFGVSHLLERSAARLSQRKQIIFCLTNGRSGSTTLAKLFGCVSSVESHHEPRPRFHPLRRHVQQNSRLARHFLSYRKFPVIARSDRPVYVETTHLIAKGFFLPMIEMGIVPDLVILTRNRRDVALSMYRLNTIPGRTERGLTWYLSPSDPVLLPLNGWEQLSDYQLCYWHVLETEVRQKTYGERARILGAVVVDVDVADLNETGRIEVLAQRLGIELTEADRARLSRARGQVHNRKSETPTRCLDAAQIDAEEAEVLARVRMEQNPDDSVGSRWCAPRRLDVSRELTEASGLR